jgi:hypothetical protein
MSQKCHNIKIVIIQKTLDGFLKKLIDILVSYAKFYNFSNFRY